MLLAHPTYGNKCMTSQNAQRDKKKVHFATLKDICHPQFQKYKGRIVLRGDIVKGDSGAYAVFAEQGSSATQMTAAEVMDVIARLPHCDGQAADAIPDSGKNGGRSQIAQNSKVRVVQTKGYVFHDTNGKNHGQTLKIQWFLLNEICTATHSLDFCGKDSSRKFCWSLDGKKYRIGKCLFVCRNKDYSYRPMWMTSKWSERSRVWLQCGRN